MDVWKNLSPKMCKVDLMSSLFKNASKDVLEQVMIIDTRSATAESEEENMASNDSEDGDDDDEYADKEEEEEEEEDDDDDDDEDSQSVVPLLSWEQIDRDFKCQMNWKHLCIPVNMLTTSAEELRKPRIEPYFETEYWEDPLPEDMINIWCDTEELFGVYGHRFHLPKPNPFIPKLLLNTCYTPQVLELEDSRGPVVIYDQSNLLVWYE
jgi:hypothetical protein